eukprot:GHVS01104887.1.p1 GENE.GHVS01104887.1~~GHVS01104887.1.p1  ORF type:complete len:332 (+),score=7.52 GHVS01104887.1:341-1336(+)
MQGLFSSKLVLLLSVVCGLAALLVHSNLSFLTIDVFSSGVLIACRTFVTYVLLSGFKINRLIFDHETPEVFTIPVYRNVTSTDLQPLYTLMGAEAFFETDDGLIYASLGNGTIGKLSNGAVTLVARTGSHDPTRCKTGILSTDYCGRPLGLVMTEGSRLFVADAWRGLLEVDVSIQPTEAELLGKLPSENVKVLSNSSTDGERILFADGLEIDKKGVNLYLTSLSQRSRIDVFAFCCFEDPPSGRLYRHNLSTGVTEVLLDRLPQPNGVVRSHDGNSLLVVLSGSKGKLRISCLTLESPSTILLDIRYAKPTCLQVQRLSADMVRSCRSTQ